MASGFQILGGDGVTNLTVGATSKGAFVELYDASGNPIPLQDRTAVAATQRYLSVSALDGTKINRALRCGEFSTLRTTSEVTLFHDAFEGSTINTWWTQSLTTFTAVQATGVLTLNNAATSAANSTAILTSLKQYAKMSRVPLFSRHRGRITANVAGNHTLVELGFGAPAGVTAIINNGAFFRWRADGTLAVVLSYNGTESVTQVLAQGVIVTTSYYYYDVIVDDDYARFIVSDSAGNPIVDTSLSLSLSVQAIWAVSHLPTFSRVYVDAVGGGTVVQLLLSAHQVEMLDCMFSLPWGEQMAGTGRLGTMNPTTYAQLPQIANGAAPATQTPSNTASAYTTLGGEYAAAATAGSENVLSLFGFTIPTPYTFMLRGLWIPLPVVQGASTATAPLLEWFLAHNASSTNLSTATGLIRVALPGFQNSPAVTVVGTLFLGQSILWQPQTPIPCLPGTVLHVGYKSITGAATASVVYRGTVFADGYFQ